MRETIFGKLLECQPDLIGKVIGFLHFLTSSAFSLPAKAAPSIPTPSLRRSSAPSQSSRPRRSSKALEE